MYCGDETGSFIGEIGSHTARFGYGGDDCPTYVVPAYADRSGHVPMSCYQANWAVNDDLQAALRQACINESYEQPVVDPACYLQQGDSVQNWDTCEHLWQSAFEKLYVRDRFKHSNGGGDYKRENDDDAAQNVAASGVAGTTLRPSMAAALEAKCTHPLLSVAPGYTHRVGTSATSTAATHRKEMTQFVEFMFEQMDAPACFVAPAPMLQAFAHGRQTALMVDLGASGCCVTPVVDGLLLHQAQRRNGRGGDYLGNVQWKALLAEKQIVRPRYYQNVSTATKLPTSKRIFHRWALQDAMYEFRTSPHVQLATWRHDPSVPFMPVDDDESRNSDKMDTDASPMNAESTYSLPDGTLVDLTTRIGKDLCRVPELLFTDELPYIDGDTAETTALLSEHATLSNAPLHHLIRDSLSAVTDVDVRKDLTSSIVLVGGSSQFANLEARLSLEVSRNGSGAFKPRVAASRFAVERHSAAWIGGSVLTSLGSFQQLWLSRIEYEEYGATLAVQRFP